MMENKSNNKQKEQQLLDRIWNAIPVTQQSFLKLLGLLEIEITTEIPTACVTTGTIRVCALIRNLWLKIAKPMTK